MADYERYPRAVQRVIEEEARTKVYEQEAMEESARWSWFDKATAANLVSMWESGKNSETGKKLTPWEFQALAEQWRQRFGEWPKGERASAKKPGPLDQVEDVQDDTVLRKREVLRLTGLSESTLKRWVKAGTFPAPFKLGPDMNAWQANHVKSWIHERINASAKPRF